MSNKIPVLGKIWLCIILAIAVFGVFGNAANISKGAMYLISTIACVAEVVGLVFMLRGKGLLYFCIYIVGYITNAVLSFLVMENVETSFLIGFVTGVAVNIGLTYLSIKKTLK